VLREQAVEPQSAYLLRFSVDGVVQQPSRSIAAAYLAPSASSLLAALGITVEDASVLRIAGECQCRRQS
jgi:hypothetical protein